MQWNLLVVCVVSLHFYNIVFIYLSQHHSHRAFLHLVSFSAGRQLSNSLSSCFLVLLWGTALIAVRTLFSKNNRHSSDVNIRPTTGNVGNDVCSMSPISCFSKHASKMFVFTPIQICSRDSHFCFSHRHST